MKEQFVQLLVQKLNEVLSTASQQFRENKTNFGIGYCAIDNLLPTEYAKQVSDSFDSKNPAWREMNSFRERKLTTKQYDQFAPILKDITFAFQDAKVIQIVENITGIANQIPDQHLYAGGLSMMRSGDFLDPHIDNSHDGDQKVYRRLNLLYYVTQNWKIEDGGHLELWDDSVLQPQTIPSFFNRLVLMETHDRSWHSVSKVKKSDGLRKCVSNYYFSEISPNGKKYSHVTSFMARPEQPVKRLFCKVDNQLRSFLRVMKKGGFGKKDVYEQKV